MGNGRVSREPSTWSHFCSSKSAAAIRLQPRSYWKELGDCYWYIYIHTHTHTHIVSIYVYIVYICICIHISIYVCTYIDTMYKIDN